jgi:hypothetical protein
LLEEDAMLSVLRDAVARGDVELLVTHLQVDEIIDTIGKDPERLKQLFHTLMQSGAREVNTYGFWLDRSRLGLADFADDETSARIAAFQGGNRRHLEDALIAATAERLGAILVTGEKTRQRYATHFPSLVVWTIDDLRSHAKGILGIGP